MRKPGYSNYRLASYKPSTRTRRHATHAHENTIFLVPIVILDQPLEHTSGFYCEDEFRVALELQIFNIGRNRIGTRAELGAVYF